MCFAKRFQITDADANLRGVPIPRESLGSDLRRRGYGKSTNLL
jgi:hypothetical protein